MRDFDHSLSEWDGTLIIFAETSGMIEPREGTFNHPPPRKFLPLMGLDLFWNINVKVKLLLQIRNERAPASAQIFWIDGNRSYARFAVDMPPCVSWILAAWTTTDNKQPGTSTTMYRFLPFVFSLRQFHVLCWLLLFSHSENHWSRSLDSPCVRHSFVSFYKMLQNFIPQPIDLGTAIKTVYCWIRRKIMGQLSPFAPWIYQIQHSIRQFPFAPSAVAHPCV